jgi:hypothetical protein
MLVRIGEQERLGPAPQLSSVPNLDSSGPVDGRARSGADAAVSVADAPTEPVTMIEAIEDGWWYTQQPATGVGEDVSERHRDVHQLPGRTPLPALAPSPCVPPG